MFYSCTNEVTKGFKNIIMKAITLKLKQDFNSFKKYNHFFIKIFTVKAHNHLFWPNFKHVNLCYQ